MGFKKQLSLSFICKSRETQENGLLIIFTTQERLTLGFVLSCRC